MNTLHALSLADNYLSAPQANDLIQLLEAAQPQVLSMLFQQVPLAGGGVALHWAQPDQYLAAGPDGELRVQAAAPEQLQDAGRNQAYAFELKPDGGAQYYLRNRDGRFVGGPDGLRLPGPALPEPARLQLHEVNLDFSQLHNACGTDHAHTHPRRPQWEEETHADIVGWAFDVFANHTNHPEADYLYKTFGTYGGGGAIPRRSALMNKLLEGLRDADIKPEYAGAILGTNLYYSHFYNPESKANFIDTYRSLFSLLIPNAVLNQFAYVTAFSEAMRYAQEAAHLFALHPNPNDQQPRLDAAYKLGLALHYVSDLSQPMHAANMINWPGLDWRHSNFEQCAEQSGVHERYQLPVAGTGWHVINPDEQEFAAHSMPQLLDRLAQKSLAVFRNVAAPIMHAADRVHYRKDNPFREETVAPILREGVPLGQRASAAFLLLWSRLGAGLRWDMGKDMPCHSPWAPSFFQVGAQTWAVIADQDARDTRFCLMNRSSSAAGVRYSPGESFVHSYSNCFEVPSVATHGYDVVMAWHARDSRSLWTAYTITGELTSAVGWQHINLPDARIKDNTSPSVVFYAGQFWMLWADYGHCYPSGEGIYCASFDTGSRSWSAARKIPGISTERSLTVAIQNNLLWMAWPGLRSDEGIFWATTTDLQYWSQQRQTPFVTGSGPGLGCLNSTMYLFWRAPNNEVHYSRYDNNAGQWSFPPMPVALSGVSSHQDVRVTTLDNRLLVGWNDSWWPHYLEVSDAYLPS